jgi:hypothetical protein
MPDTSSISITFDRTDNAAFSGFAKGSANGFFAARLTAPREGYFDASMRRGLWLFITLAAGLWGNPGIAAEFAMADDVNRSVAAPAIGSNPRLPNQSMPLTRPVPGVLSGVRQRSPRQARRPSRAQWIAVDIERSEPRLAGLMLRCGKARHRSCRRFVAEPFPPHARPQTTSRTRGYRRGNSVAGDATSLVKGPWRTARELEIKVADGGAPIDAIAALSGLQKAPQSLNAE